MRSRDCCPVNKAGEVKVLAEEADGVKFGCLNDLDVGADGTIYFTEASNKFPMAQFTNDLLEHQPNGRLLALEPQSRRPRTLLRGIYFANGVAVSPDQTFVFVAETGKYRSSACLDQGTEDGPERHFYR